MPLLVSNQTCNYCKYFSDSKLTEVREEMLIIPMTEELHDETTEFKISEDIGHLPYMSQNLEKRILAKKSIQRLRRWGLNE